MTPREYVNKLDELAGKPKSLRERRRNAIGRSLAYALAANYFDGTSSVDAFEKELKQRGFRVTLETK